MKHYNQEYQMFEFIKITPILYDLYQATKNNNIPLMAELKANLKCKREECHAMWQAQGRAIYD